MVLPTLLAPLRPSLPSRVALVLFAVTACGGPPPKSSEELARDGVPANSASEARLQEGADSRGGATASRPETVDPSRPYTVPVEAEPPAPTRAEAPAKPGEKVSKKECAGLFDRYLNLAIANDPRFADVPPEMLDQLKSQGLSMAAQQAADPCASGTVTRAAYTCAMHATTPDAWERCLK